MKKILNWIDGAEKKAAAGFFIKFNPHNGKPIFSAARSGEAEIDAAVAAAEKARNAWSGLTPVKRGEILNEFAHFLKKNKNQIAETVVLETGRTYESALGETDGAISLAYFFAGEGQRLYGKTVSSGVANRQVQIIRQPLGVAALIIAANTPIANIAWKVFPALICGNTVVLKAAEDAPATAWLFGKLAADFGLPAGVLNIVQGLGPEAGTPLVEHPGVRVISFTGSTAVGREIALKASTRFCRHSLELGGKNPLVVCDDADLEKAAQWTLLSAFSNAGQRCSAASRILIFDRVYESFRRLLLKKTQKLRVGIAAKSNLGPLINEKQLNKVLTLIERAKKTGALVIAGGKRLRDAAHTAGFYLAPTLLENVKHNDELSITEIFAPVAVLYRVKDLREAVFLANDSPYGLTAAIHTKSLHRAQWFAENVEAGIVSINGGTYGSEPHLPFGGLKNSGNGTREPGVEALDVYTELKNIYLNFDPENI